MDGKQAGREVVGLTVTGSGALLFMALATYDLRDYPERAFPAGVEVRNALGTLGRDVAGTLFDWVGVYPSFAVALGAAIVGLLVLRRSRAAEAPAPDALFATRSPEERASGRIRLTVAQPAEDVAPARPARLPWAGLAFVRPLGAVAVVLAAATVEWLLARAGTFSSDAYVGRNLGGYWGAFLGGKLVRNFAPALGYALATAFGLVGMLIAADVEIFPSRHEDDDEDEDLAPIPLATPAPEPIAVLSVAAPARPLATPRTLPLPVPSFVTAPDPGPVVRVARREPSQPAPVPSPVTESPPPAAPVAASPGTIHVTSHGTNPAIAARIPEPESPADPLPAQREHQLSLGSFDVVSDTTAPPIAAYAVPPLTMLTPTEAGPVEEFEAVMREKADVLARTLANFKLDARVVAVERGPNITQYELELAAGVKVQRILSLSDDLALALKSPSIRIIAPIPGKSTVGIEVPNQDQDVVRLRELIECEEFGKREFAIPLFLGKDSTGNPLIADLTKMPHLLIAGATGSGKSVCMNTIIVSVLMVRTPAQVKMILIDPKMVELSLYAQIPHLLAPVVTDMKKAPAVLDWAVNKMEERYGLLSRAEVRHVRDYNALGAEVLAERFGCEVADLPGKKVPLNLPYIVVVIDEFADLMCVAKKEVETQIVRLAQKARAVGIHLILATQRPTADVITGLIKSNMPCRIAFQVAAKVDSRTIIDKNGAEMLVGQGDMLFLPPGTSSVIRAQGTYVSEDEVKAVVKFTKAAAAPEFQPELVKWEAGEGGGDGGEEDDLYDQAVRVVLETQRGSASLLQRRLEVGYSRASRLIDIMTERGILGPFKGSKAREILLTVEDWDAMQARKAGLE